MAWAAIFTLLLAIYYQKITAAKMQLDTLNKVDRLTTGDMRKTQLTLIFQQL